MPSEAHYERMIEVLRASASALRTAEGERERLDLCLSALRGVIIYLGHDPAVVDERLTSPLGEIENALHNAGRGATVPLLEHAPDRPGKPTGTVREDVQAGLAIAVDLLVASRMRAGDAVRWVAAEARRTGVRAEDGGAISHEQIESWRSEISREKAPAGARETFGYMRRYPHHAELLKSPRTEAKRPKAEALARGLISALGGIDPRAASPRTRRARG
jgi:hypothetical protein